MTDLHRIRYITPKYAEEVAKQIVDNPIIRGRAADMYWIMRNMPLSPEAHVLEFGAWPADNWRVAHQRWKNLMVTDSFEWLNERGLQGVPDESEWLTPIVEAGLDHGKLDVQFMIYAEKFDGIYSVSVLEHVVHDDLALENIFHALKPGGWFVFTTEMNPYIGMPYAEDIWFRVYQQEHLARQLRRAGFEVNGQAEPYEDFEDQFRHAINNPYDLRFPYKHFRSAGVAARKPS